MASIMYNMLFLKYEFWAISVIYVQTCYYIEEYYIMLLTRDLFVHLGSYGSAPANHYGETVALNFLQLYELYC